MREQGFRGLILVMDNATIHRSRETRLFLERHRMGR
jgi:transposase